MRPCFRPLAIATLSLLGACNFAPDYVPPSTPEPKAFKEATDWIEAQPDDAVPRGAWWKVFGDAELDALEDQVTKANQNLKAAVAQYQQARAVAGIARAAYFPVITGNTGVARDHISRTVANKASISTFNDLTAGADLSYEIDVWGRVRNVVAANEDQAEASAADLASVELSLHAELASDYFTLRGDDASQVILNQTVAADQQAYDLTKRRFDGGVSPEADLDQAETQLENAKTQASDMQLQRAQLEHAIAILTGKAPTDLTLAAAPLVAKPPHMNAGFPALLLQRRPDIAATERRTAAANAEIGVAHAAYFPTFNITAMLGIESASLSQWAAAPSQFWSLGPSAVMPIFEGGQIRALNDEARAAYDEQVAIYRQTVLNAFGEVEDNLVALHKLEEEDKSQARATAAAERALLQANNLYKQGATTYLDVVISQDNELQARLALVTIAVRRLIASVLLVEALGGGWEAPASP